MFTWNDFLSESRIRGVSDERKSSIDAELLVAERRLSERDSIYFASRLARREHWRCLGDFDRSVAFLDIETTGISLRAPVTVVGVYDGRHMHTLVRGQNLSASSLRAMLSSPSVIVTFNGSSFDLPIIEANFPGSVPRVPHVDLKHAMRRIGYAGGLKRIERDMGIERDRRVEYMTGEDAVYLWRLWEKHGKRNALDLLMEYNSEDCRNMKTLADFAYTELKRRTFDDAVVHCKD
ncbi:MAG: ribonuclease H-like domain-containing protein [Thermoplasmata archaeon]